MGFAISSVPSAEMALLHQKAADDSPEDQQDSDDGKHSHASFLK
jgi:hypothetical protein